MANAPGAQNLPRASTREGGACHPVTRPRDAAACPFPAPDGSRQAPGCTCGCRAAARRCRDCFAEVRPATIRRPKGPPDQTLTPSPATIPRRGSSMTKQCRRLESEPRKLAGWLWRRASRLWKGKWLSGSLATTRQRRGRMSWPPIARDSSLSFLLPDWRLVYVTTSLVVLLPL